MESKTHSSQLKGNKQFSKIYRYGIALFFGMPLLVYIVASALPSQAAINRVIPFSASLQGASSDAAVPDGNYSITFSFYTAETGGTALWSETQTIGVEGGLVSAKLGSVTAIPSSITFNDGVYYLGVKVGSDPEMTPRRTMGAIPQAFNADTVDGAHAGTGANNVLLLDSSGNIDIAGSAAIGGTLQAGSSTLDSLSVSGAVTVGGNLSVTGNIIPSATGTYDLGTSSNRFANAYIDNLVVGSVSTSGTSADSFTINDDATGDANSALNFYRGGSLTAAQILWNSTADQFEFNNGLSIAGALTATGVGTFSATGGNAVAITGAPAASATSSLLQLGSAIAGGSSNGTYIGLNAALGYTGNLVDLQVDGTRALSVSASGDMALLGSLTSGGLTVDTSTLHVDATNNRVGIGVTDPNNTIEVAGLINFDSAVYGTFLGVSAGASNTTGQVNTAVGHLALNLNTTGTRNTALGYAALQNTVTGSYNTGVGSFALQANTASNNTGIGFASLATNTSGSNNTGLGYYALVSNTTGSNNIALGYEALRNNLTANYNVGIGSGALRYNAYGTSNIAMGYQAGYGSNGFNPSRNIFIGDSVGVSILEANNNVMIGHSTGSNLTSGSSNILLGYDVDLAAGTDSNVLNIGNLLRGDLSAGEISIGTTNTDAKLQVVGTTEQLRLGYSTSAYTALTVSSGGDLTVAPTGGDISITGTLAVSSNATVGGTLGVTGAATLSSTLDVSGIATFSNTGANAVAVSGAPAASSSSSLLQVGTTLSGGSSGGTYLSVNSDNGFTGNLIDLKYNGYRRFRIDYDGNFQLIDGSAVDPDGNSSFTINPGYGNTINGAGGITLSTTSGGVIKVINAENSEKLGVLSVGRSTALFDGSSAGHFDSDVATGTLIAGNAESGFTGNLLDLQVAGSSLLKVTYQGAISNSTWNGTTIGAAYGGTGINSSSSTGIATVSSGTWSIASSLSADKGGTGQTSYTVGDLLYASSTSALSKLAAVATGQVLVSNGVGTAPSWSATPSLTSVTTATLTSVGSLAVTSASNGNISITPHGTGDIVLNTDADTDLIIGDGGTTNYTKFDSNGAVTFAGGARPYGEITLLPKDATTGGTNSCASGTVTTNAWYTTLDCDQSTDENAFWQFKLPSNYVSGSNVQVDVGWISSATSGAVVYTTWYAGVADTEEFDNPSLTAVSSTAATTNGTANRLNTTSVTWTAPSLAPDDLVQFKLTRDADNGSDTMAADARVINIRVRYLVGS